MENKALEALLTVGRFLIMFSIYVGFLCIMNSSLKVDEHERDTSAIGLPTAMSGNRDDDIIE